MGMEDTGPEARRVWAEVLRRLTGPEKLAAVSSLTSFVHSLARAGLRERMPGATEGELEAAWFRLVLGRDLADKVLDYRREVRGRRSASA